MSQYVFVFCSTARTLLELLFSVSSSNSTYNSFYLKTLRDQSSKYGLLTKREVKMAGYCPSSFFCVFVYGPRRSRGP